MAKLSPSGAPIAMVLRKDAIVTLVAEDAFAVVDMTKKKLIGGAGLGNHRLEGATFFIQRKTPDGEDVLTMKNNDQTVVIGAVHADVRQQLVAWVTEINALIAKA